ncbi:MAG: thioredoxin domain-containing protein [Patescibacteria group bacterium]
MKKYSLILLLSFISLTACANGSANTGPRTLGNANAKVLIEEFSDPQCPACGVISPAVEQLVRENPDLVRLEYYHFPLSYHQYSFIAAEAAECAGDQGKFFEYLGTLFKNQNSLSEDFFDNIADSMNLDRAEFDACLDNHEHKAKILSHMEEGKRRGLPGTPTLYVNGEMVKWSGAESFKGYLESL